jgi:predicted ATP-grasp superfamily ATP-dependent carboligase
MRVFVYEYFCAAGGGPDRAALQAEGRAMLSAVREDLERVPEVQAVTLPPVAPEAEERAFRALARDADWSLVVAPECDGLLAQRCRWAEEEGGRLLGPSSAAVRLTGDKLELARHLLARGVPTPPSEPWPGASPPFAFPLVCKPRHGAGSQATFIVRDGRELARCVEPARAEGWEGEMIVQPFAPGRAVSVAFLTGPAGGVALPAAEQVLSEGRFHYQGGRLPLPDDLKERSQRLAGLAVATVAGLCGYVGVDLVLGEAADGGDRVIEINPRLTTSYVGLRALARFNLAEALLAAAAGAALPPLRWRPGPVHFYPDGRVRA